jgi:glyoxylase-like metal-dependent hydrolase (beta-lactamase superfamily II)
VPLELRFLPASEGDAIWIRWGDALDHQLLIDMGKGTDGKAIRKRIEALEEAKRKFDLLVITHIDGDHIGGVLTGVAEAPALEGLSFADIWFNGWTHLRGGTVPKPGQGRLEPLGAAQGERLTSWLTGPWNEAFGRGPVRRADPLQTIPVADGLTLTVLGPTAERLQQLKATWDIEVEIAIRRGTLAGPVGRLERLGRQRPARPTLATLADLEALANRYSPLDSSPSNGTSITLLLEWGGRRVLLTGDAFAPDVVEGVGLLDGPAPAAIDVFKLPHHGSEKNVTDALVRAVACPAWVFSTNGNTHYHPDAAAVARVVRQKVDPRPALLFNVPSEFNGWWSDPDWKAGFDYSTETGTDEDGLTLSMQRR